MTDEEILKMKKRFLYEVFKKGYQNIQKEIDAFFGSEESIKKEQDEELIKEYTAFKEIMMNSVDDIYKEILKHAYQARQSRRLLDRPTTEHERDYEEEQPQRQKGFWD